MSNNAELQNRKDQAIARGQGNLAPVFVERAENAEIWDVEGRRYIDFGSGIAVVNTGHLHPAVQAAVQEQVGKLSHSCVMVTPYESSVELAEKVNALAPGDTPKKSIYVTTGAEAVENAIKIARAYTGRHGVIAFNGGFHGRTLLALGLTGKITPYKNLFGPFPGEIYHAPMPIEFHGISEQDALKAIDNLFQVDIAATDVAAIIIEPVQGEGGFYAASDTFMQAVRSICDEHGIVMIADEIQTGFGRTGRFFCSEYSGVEPDIITLAKGLAGGFPLAMVTGKADIMDAPLPGGLGGTYAGSPVGCAAALAIIDVIEKEQLVQRANELGARFGDHLRELQARYPHVIGEIRADRGAMIAMELVHEGDANQPNADLTRDLTTLAPERGLILLSCGFHGNVIRFLPPLTISNALVDEGMGLLADMLEELLGVEQAKVQTA